MENYLINLSEFECVKFHRLKTRQKLFFPELILQFTFEKQIFKFDF